MCINFADMPDAGKLAVGDEAVTPVDSSPEKTPEKTPEPQETEKPAKEPVSTKEEEPASTKEEEPASTKEEEAEPQDETAKTMTRWLLTRSFPKYRFY